jgi:hypothetical protein
MTGAKAIGAYSAPGACMPRLGLTHTDARIVLEAMLKRWLEWEVDYGRAATAHTASVRGSAACPRLQLLWPSAAIGDAAHHGVAGSDQRCMLSLGPHDVFRHPQEVHHAARQHREGRGSLDPDVPRADPLRQ